MVEVWTLGLAERWNRITDTPEFSWPEVGFEEIAVVLPEARLNEALSADAFACSVSAVCL